MSLPEQQQELARRFLEVVPRLLHGISAELRCMDAVHRLVTMAQFRTMAALHRGPRSLSELATLHEVSAPTMSRLISTLVERGWVLRERDPGDRRQVILRLTPEGEAVWNTMSERSIKHLAETLAELTPAEQAGLGTALAGVARVVAARRRGTRENHATTR
ncbi:MAG: MarR family transcriptional regulator [Ardenticatenaceae bacterium]|nr:MarR family transcriptional regulator [Ardenticatenaceae bacterium]